LGVGPEATGKIHIVISGPSGLRVEGLSGSESASEGPSRISEGYARRRGRRPAGRGQDLSQLGLVVSPGVPGAGVSYGPEDSSHSPEVSSHGPEVSVHQVDVPARVVKVYLPSPGGKKKGKVKKLSPPKTKDPYRVLYQDKDPYRVLYRDVRHFEMPSGVRRARKAARKAAEKNREFSVVFERASVVPRGTLGVLDDVGRKAGLSEISLHVEQDK
jgi:hypothetical protein